MEEGKCKNCGHKVRRVFIEKYAIPKYPSGNYKEVINRKFEVFHFKKRGGVRYTDLCMYSDSTIGFCKCENPEMLDSLPVFKDGVSLSQSKKKSRCLGATSPTLAGEGKHDDVRESY